MLVGLVTLVLSVVAVALVPVVMMAALFRLVDYLADDEKLAEIRRARRESRPVDFSRARGNDEQSTSSGQSPTETADDAQQCPSCGVENEREFDRCWNCQTTL